MAKTQGERRTEDSCCDSVRLAPREPGRGGSCRGHTTHSAVRVAGMTPINAARENADSASTPRSTQDTPSYWHNRGLT